jgi:hypothetical protein
MSSSSSDASARIVALEAEVASLKQQINDLTQFARGEFQFTSSPITDDRGQFVVVYRKEVLDALEGLTAQNIQNIALSLNVWTAVQSRYLIASRDIIQKAFLFELDQQKILFLSLAAAITGEAKSVFFRDKLINVYKAYALKEGYPQ